MRYFIVGTLMGIVGFIGGERVSSLQEDQVCKTVHSAATDLIDDVMLYEAAGLSDIPRGLVASVRRLAVETDAYDRKQQ